MDAAENFAHAIARTFSTQPRRVGREWRVCCPVHEADGGMHKPSLAIWDRPNNSYAFKCMTGCSRESVREALAARGVAVARAGASSIAQRLAAAQQQESKRLEQLLKASLLVIDSTPPRYQGAVFKYLQGRHLPVYDHLDCIREYGNDLVGVITDLSSIDPGDDSKARATGVSVLSLNADGTPKTTDGKKFRSIIGTQKGFGVPFGKAGPTLLVAEGIETMIAGMKLLDVGFGVAVLSASNMANLIVPEWVDNIVVAVDNDAAGWAAAYALEAQVANLVDGFTIKWWGDPDSGWDAADELMKRSTP